MKKPNVTVSLCHCVTLLKYFTYNWIVDSAKICSK